MRHPYDENIAPFPQQGFGEIAYVGSLPRQHAGQSPTRRIARVVQAVKNQSSPPGSQFFVEKHYILILSFNHC